MSIEGLPLDVSSFKLPTARWLSGPSIDAAFAGGGGSSARMGCDGEAIANIGPDINDAAARPSGAAVHGLKAVGDPGPPSVTLRMACPPISFVRDGSPEACCVYWHLFRYGYESPISRGALAPLGRMEPE